MRIVVTGGAGFIGSAVCRMLVAERGATVLNLDKLTATSSLASMAGISGSPRYSFRKADICERDRVAALLHAFAPDAIVHAAADRHWDDCAGEPMPAVETNLLGTWRVLEAAREYWCALTPERQSRFRFLSVSSLQGEATPAAANRSAADELVTAWHRSYGLPTIVSRAADTLGPFQFPHEIVPAAVIAAIEGEPVGMKGEARCGWLFVEDHVRALAAMLDKGTPGATYRIAGQDASPAAIAERIRRLAERHGRRTNGRSGGPSRLIALQHGSAALAHETAVAASATTANAARLEHDTGWKPEETLESALSKTVRWYLANEAWWRPLQAAQAAGHDFGGLIRSATGTPHVGFRLEVAGHRP